MKLYADSGSTKTEWILVENKKNVHQFETIGMNPFFVKEEDIYPTLDEKLTNYLFKDINEINFFGAGCSTKSKAKWLKSIFSKIFSNAKIKVHTDIELAVLASTKKGEKSIVSILGTGSSFRIFNGKKVKKKYSSLGYILGDEGSGTHIAKELLRKIYYFQLSDYIYDLFFDKYKLKRDEIIENIYSKPFPNRFLAQFATFCNDNIEDEEIEQIVLDSFYSFFENHISNVKNFQNYQLQFVGSIAFYFKEQLHQIADEFDCEIDLIIQKPLKFHLDKIIK